MRDRMLVASTELVCYTAVFSVDTKNGCVADYYWVNPWSGVEEFWGGGGVEKNERTAWSQVYWLGMDRSDWTTGQSWLIVKYSLQQDTLYNKTGLGG